MIPRISKKVIFFSYLLANLASPGKATIFQKIEGDMTDGMFVTVGNRGTLLTSTNGTLWNQRNIWTRKIQGTIKSLFAVTYGKGIFVTVGSMRHIFTSKTGVSWRTKHAAFS